MCCCVCCLAATHAKLANPNRNRCALCTPQDEPLRLSKNWGMCLVVFAMWDALLLWAAWWSCGRFGNEAVQEYTV